MSRGTESIISALLTCCRAEKFRFVEMWCCRCYCSMAKTYRFYAARRTICFPRAVDCIPCSEEWLYKKHILEATFHSPSPPYLLAHTSNIKFHIITRITMSKVQQAVASKSMIRIENSRGLTHQLVLKAGGLTDEAANAVIKGSTADAVVASPEREAHKYWLSQSKGKAFWGASNCKRPSGVFSFFSGSPGTIGNDVLAAFKTFGFNTEVCTRAAPREMPILGHIDMRSIAREVLGAKVAQNFRA